MTDHVDPNLFRQAMRLTAASVAVVSTDGSSGRAGLTVSSLCSLSVEPPALIFCVNRASRSLGALMENGVFAANFLANGQSRIADVFAGIAPEFAQDRFAIGDWRTLVTGAPVLGGALCNFDCRIAQTFEFSTHRIVVGDVLAVLSGSTEPLIFSDRRYHRLSAT